jgi:integrase
MEKIDIHDSQEIFNRSLVVLKKQIPTINADLIKKYCEDSSIGKTQLRGKQAGVRTQTRNIFLLKTISRFFKHKPFNKLTEQDIEKLIKALNENKLKKLNGSPYSEQVKSNLKITFVSFLRYVMGDTPKFHKLTSWIDSSYKKKEVVELSEGEVLKMLNKCITLRQKIIIAGLFDSGARIEEFLNVRVEDCILVEGAVPYYKFRLREEFSKTEGRVVSLLWKHTTPILKGWLEECPNKNKLHEPLFPTTYDGVRKTLYKIGKKALGRSVNPHLFRHSSATFYASRGYDYFQLCKRFGWQIGSNVPHKYIHKSGIKEKEVVEKFKKESLEDLEKEIDMLKEREKNRNDETEEQKKQIEILKEQVESMQSFKEPYLKDREQLADLMKSIFKNHPDFVEGVDNKLKQIKANAP